jgi:dimethylhistidine N-methyltransferase
MDKTDGYTLLHPRSFDTESLARERFALDVLQGLSSLPRGLPSLYLYDEAGSELFASITDCADYYPTRCEAEILTLNKGAIADVLSDMGTRVSVVELGAGDGRKTKILLKEFIARGADFRYVPIDISESAVAGLAKDLKTGFPDLETAGIVAEYFDGLRWLNRQDEGPKFVLFLGSNIGNFDPAKRRVFLRTLWNALSDGDYLLTGFDLKKDIDVMLRAYNDRDGLTRRFNVNLLERMNRELRANFQIGDWTHYGTYDVQSGAMESYLVSLKQQQVLIGELDRTFEFRPFEPVHLEYSYKYLPEEIDTLAEETGYRPVGRFYDTRSWFMDAVWRVSKGR